MSGRVAVMRWVFGLVVVGIVGLQPAGAGAQTGGGGWGKLSGVVTDEQGNPIDDASIQLQVAGGKPWWDHSDSNGRYGSFVRFELIESPIPGKPPAVRSVHEWPREPGRYMLIVRKEGFEPYGEIVNIAGDMDTTHNVVLKRKVTPRFWVYFNGGYDRATFTNTKTGVCTNKVIPDFKTAGFDDFSCAADA